MVDWRPDQGRSPIDTAVVAALRRGWRSGENAELGAKTPRECRFTNGRFGPPARPERGCHRRHSGAMLRMAAERERGWRPKDAVCGTSSVLLEVVDWRSDQGRSPIDTAVVAALRRGWRSGENAELGAKTPLPAAHYMVRPSLYPSCTALIALRGVRQSPTVWISLTLSFSSR